MQLPFFRGEGGGRGTQKKINQEIIANELISLTSNVVLWHEIFAHDKCKALTCSTIMPEALREEYTSCNMDDAPSNAEVEQ